MSVRRRGLLFLSGFTALAAGSLVYLLLRDPGSVYFLSGFHLGGQEVSGVLGGSLPGLLHTFAFLLMAAAVFHSFARCPGWPCALGSIAEGLLEMGQHDAVSARIAPLVPGCLSGIPVLDQTRAFFLHGTFDIRDLVAISVGGVAAYLVIRKGMRETGGDTEEGGA